MYVVELLNGHGNVYTRKVFTVEAKADNFAYVSRRDGATVRFDGVIL